MGPIRGQTRQLPITADIVPEVQHLGAKLNASIHNRFDIEVVDAATGRVKQKAFAENVILNKLWANHNWLSTMWFSYIAYGTGSGTPAVTDSGLFKFSAAKSCVTDAYTADYANGVVSRKRRITLSETEAVGVSITEVGVASSSDNSYVFTHAMLQDMNGNQISIAKTNTDIINIYATVFAHINTQNNGLFIDVDASNLIKTTLGASQISGSYAYYQSFFTPGTPVVKGSSVSGTSNASITYSADYKTVTLKFPRVGVAEQNNAGGVGAIVSKLGIAAIVGQGSSPCFSGTDIEGEAVGTGDGSTQDFALDFAFATDATIYTDGAAASSGVTVSKIPYYYGDMGQYLIPLSAGGMYAVNAPSLCSKDPGESVCLNAAASQVYFNPYYELGLSSINTRESALRVSFSNDLSTWTDEIGGSATTYSIPAAYQHYKYIKARNASASYIYPHPALYALNITSFNAIHFDTAPASGAVITADYHTDTIAKDANHVFDYSFAITVGPYSE